jgi:MFS transporter, DHA1 family, chloramphenicol/florfenicol resistance protein
VATFATVRDVYADRPEGVVIYGLFSSMLAFVPALAPVLGAFIEDGLGWRAIFWLLAIITTLPLAHALFRWHETRPVGGVESRSAWPILRSWPFWLYTAAFGAAMGTFFVFFSIAPRILIDRLGYSELHFSLAFATAALVMTATARLYHREASQRGA